MVAVIKTGHSILRLLNYNEHKVKAGAAICIGAENYPMEVGNLAFHEKLNRLKNQASLNENVTRNSIHISLNFDPAEKLTDDTLLAICSDYMRGIGMDDLPYLVYRHFDAAHPHIHIVSVKVRGDGSRVDTQNIGRNQSEKSRRKIEQKYDLVRAEDSQRRNAFELKPVNSQRVSYGRSETKRAIANVLGSVLKNYRYSSLPELNSVLRGYNVMADRGSEDSRVFQNQGLVYRVLDDNGNPVGVPIKSSDFYDRPGLKFLQQRFRANNEMKQTYKGRIRNAIDLAFINGGIALSGLIGILKAEGIDTVLRENTDGVIYGITYVDHQTRCVFNGSALGKSYGANAILQRCTGKAAGDGKIKTGLAVKDGLRERGSSAKDLDSGLKSGGLMETLLEPGYQAEQMDWQLKRWKRKRKRQQWSRDY